MWRYQWLQVSLTLNCEWHNAKHASYGRLSYALTIIRSGYFMKASKISCVRWFFSWEPERHFASFVRFVWKALKGHRDRLLSRANSVWECHVSCQQITINFRMRRRWWNQLLTICPLFVSLCCILQDSAEMTHSNMFRRQIYLGLSSAR